MIVKAKQLKNYSSDLLSAIIESYNNDKYLRESLAFISNRLETLTESALERMREEI